MSNSIAMAVDVPSNVVRRDHPNRQQKPRCTAAVSLVSGVSKMIEGAMVSSQQLCDGAHLVGEWP